MIVITTLPGGVDVCGPGSWLVGWDTQAAERVCLVSELQCGAGRVQLQNPHQQQWLWGHVCQRDLMNGPGQRRVQLQRRHVSRRRRQERRERERCPNLTPHPIRQLPYWPQRRRRPPHTELTETHRLMIITHTQSIIQCLKEQERNSWKKRIAFLHLQKKCKFLFKLTYLNKNKLMINYYYFCKTCFQYNLYASISINRLMCVIMVIVLLW